jgi:hypothetical protein
MLAVFPLAGLLGYLGFVLPIPGVSLAYPAIVVLAIGSAVAVGSLLLMDRRPRLVTADEILRRVGRHRGAVKAFAVVTGLITLAATLWTVEFGLPASLAWNSDATNQAQRVLAHVDHSTDVTEGIPRRPCLEFNSGSVGPVRAPYTACAVSMGQGSFVTFVSQGASGGIAYTEAGPPAFEDQCYRHLVGDWYSFGAVRGSPGDCPFGYRYSGPG